MFLHHRFLAVYRRATVRRIGFGIETEIPLTPTPRYGSVPHAGFGLGLERLMMYLAGLKNFRDVIPFPCTEALKLRDGSGQVCLKIAAQVERSALTQGFFDLNRSVSESAIKADGA